MAVYAYRYECPKCSEDKTIFTDIKNFTAPISVKCEKPGCDGVGIPKDWAVDPLDVKLKDGPNDATKG